MRISQGGVVFYTGESDEYEDSGSEYQPGNDKSDDSDFETDDENRKKKQKKKKATPRNDDKAKKRKNDTNGNASSSTKTTSPVSKKKVRAVVQPFKKREERPFNSLLAGVVFGISGYENPLRSELRNKAMSMGARYEANWNCNCTHLICAFRNTPKFRQVRGQGKIVKKDWIEQCYSRRMRIPWRRFALDGNDASQPESEEEIYEQIDRPTPVKRNACRDSSDGGDTDEEIERVRQKQKRQNNGCVPSTSGESSSRSTDLVVGNGNNVPDNSDDKKDAVGKQTILNGCVPSTSGESSNRSTNLIVDDNNVKNSNEKKDALGKQKKLNGYDPSISGASCSRSDDVFGDSNDKKNHTDVCDVNSLCIKTEVDSDLDNSNEKEDHTDVSDVKGIKSETNLCVKMEVDDDLNFQSDNEGKHDIMIKNESVYEMDTEEEDENYWSKNKTEDTTLPYLPPFFHGATIALLDDISESDRKLLKRYIKAHQGNIANEDTDLNTVLYAVTEDATAIERVREDYPQVIGVTPEWVWRSHDEGKLLPGSPFIV